MDGFTEKQKWIEQRRVEAAVNYPALWSRMISEWNASDPHDRGWLTYSANYLFRTRHIRWAIDPLTLNWRIKDAPRVDAAGDLGRLSFVLLTHGHKDHLDLDLLSALRHLPITWIVPEFMLSRVMTQAGLPREKIVVPSPLLPIEIHGVHILPFDGLHWETEADGSLTGVPAVGYLIKCHDRQWLFPGDTRDFDAGRLPAFGSVDLLFAHLWLGRGAALLDQPPRLDSFCRFLLDLNPHQIVLTHLHELGRDARDYWDESHVQVVNSHLRGLAGTVPVSFARMGESVLL